MFLLGNITGILLTNEYTMLVPLKHIEKGDCGSHDFDENRGFLRGLGIPGIPGPPGGARGVRGPS